MPKRLFEGISERQMRSFAEGNSISISSSLPPLYQTLFHWLIDLLAEVASHYHSSKMDPFNLGFFFFNYLFSD